jgi:hypothetical protein
MGFAVGLGLLLLVVAAAAVGIIRWLRTRREEERKVDERIFAGIDQRQRAEKSLQAENYADAADAFTHAVQEFKAELP